MDAVEYLKTLDRMCHCECLNACPMDVFSDADINCNTQPCFECKKEFWLAEVE